MSFYRTLNNVHNNKACLFPRLSDAIGTLAQTVDFMYREEGFLAASDTSPFANVSGYAYYATAVQLAVANNIAVGTTAITFSPDNACTRAQIVSFLYRAA